MGGDSPRLASQRAVAPAVASWLLAPLRVPSTCCQSAYQPHPLLQGCGLASVAILFSLAGAATAGMTALDPVTRARYRARPLHSLLSPPSARALVLSQALVHGLALASFDVAVWAGLE